MKILLISNKVRMLWLAGLVATMAACSSDSNVATAISFVHKADVTNSTFNWTEITDPSLDGNPDAQILVTQNWNPGDVGGTYNNNVIGVWYTGTKWAIFNQDQSVAIPTGAAFNVRVMTGLSSAVLHTADVANSTGNTTDITTPSLDANPDAVFQITHNFNPGDVVGTSNNSVIGAWYTGTQWSIFNQDEVTAIPTGSAFNIQVTATGTNNFVHTADVININGNYTEITHTSLDGNPDATFQVTQNWNPGDVGGTYNNNVIGVWYTGTKWAIFNQDGFIAIPTGAAFNISID